MDAQATFFDNFLDDTHRLLYDTCRRFAEREIAPHALEWEEAESFPRELYKKAAEAGIHGVGFPEEMGGAGGGPLHMVMAIEGLLRGGSTGVVASLTSLGIALPAIVQSEDARLIDRFVRPVLAGEKIAALAITEPGTGSDVAGVKTRAVREGDHYVVDGAKIFITSGVRADVLTTLVRTSEDPHGGLSFLVIERDRPGVTVSRALKKTGWRASDTAELGFSGVRVPVENRVGPEGGGFVTLMRNFQHERLALAALGAATAAIALEESERYVRERHAFGRPIAGFQVTRHKIADMATRVLAARTLVYQVAWRMARGEYLVKEVSMAKNLTAETAVSVTYDAVQLFGGMGYMRETLVERLSRDARILPIGGGTQEIMKEIIARNMGF
ncbi:MAG TPA: acyl-CoA dehydrogenase family protein [Polyangia bacterium]|jgi:acyl-CoA dehydrogenase|nr:acyl-CoA dehydrogenase family protein [Polyangia bacterium]